MGGNGNRLVPAIAAVALLLVLVVFMRPGGKTDPGRAGAPHTAPAPDADTAADTLRAMAVQVSEVKSQAEHAKRDAEQSRKQQAEEIARFKSEMQAERTNAQQAIERREKDNLDLVRRMEEMTKRLAPGSGTPQPSQSQPFQGAVQSLQGLQGDLPVGGHLGGNTGGGVDPGLVWVEPLDHRGTPALQGGTLATPTASATGQSLLHDGTEIPKPKPDEPAYTVPRNSTLVGSTAMTALIGRVPIKGQIEDPFPFKVLVGQDNLAANGLEIPGVFGMVFSGTAFGDWTLGCVRGHVDSVTFVFDDGRTRTLSADGGQGVQSGSGSSGTSASVGSPSSSGGLSGSGTSGNLGSGTTIHKGLGWISDRRGIPCVSGTRISNATDYLAGRMLARTIETAGKAYARSQQTINTTPLGGAINTVNNAAQFALGETVAGSSSELAQFIAERQAQMFDVIYVDTGAEVAIHIDKEIPIDYQFNGRKLDYARASSRESGRGGLD